MGVHDQEQFINNQALKKPVVGDRWYERFCIRCGIVRAVVLKRFVVVEDKDKLVFYNLRDYAAYYRYKGANMAGKTWCDVTRPKAPVKRSVGLLKIAGLALKYYANKLTPTVPAFSKTFNHGRWHLKIEKRKF